ncbi:MAG: hypothetical protein Unbinned176contig1000_15 [Prokaryotic dsDNA virus sp.]|nr:MAG: hypothetical protein Unbinned176contig1000_15 [Prokaryotic dsDNA virus sp.]|tara:strand:+ start:11302 stop:11850 length:549 start_codon:yes stop_codon:yes gene_type:complete
MRTREKFYKNLSKFNVGHEKRVERFEFQDVKTLDGLSKKADKLTTDLKKAIDQYIDLDIIAEDWSDKETDATNQVDDEIERKKVIVAERVKAEKQADKNIEKAKKIEQKMYEKMVAADEKADKALSIARGLKSQAEQLVDQMRGAIKSFESSAKALGVDVSGNISSYESAANKLDAATLKLK